MSAPVHTRGELRLVAVASLLLALVIGWLSISTTGIPPRAELGTASGRVEWVSLERYGVEFAFVGDARLFDYPSKANAMGNVESALRQSAGRKVTVLYDHETHGPAYSDRRLHTVYEIAVDGRVVRSYDAVRAAWASDDAIAPWLAGAFLLSAALMWILSYRCPP